MSNEFIKYTTECGITCQHTVQNCPQQNSVAEHASRFLTKHISTMLNESGMARSFRRECLAALVHIWNWMLRRSHLKTQHLTKHGTSKPQMCPTNEHGDLQSMCTYKRKNVHA